MSDDMTAAYMLGYEKGKEAAWSCLEQTFIDKEAAHAAARDRVLELLEKAADDSGIPNEAGGFTLAADIVRREMGGK